MSRDSSRRPFNSRPRDAIEQISDYEELTREAKVGGVSSAFGSAKNRAPKVAPAVLEFEPKAVHQGKRDQAGAADPLTSVPVPIGNLKTVCVVEAFTAIRQLTVNYINHMGGFKVINASETFEEGVKACASLGPDVAIVDGCMTSEAHGTSLSRAIQASSPGTRVLVFCPSAHPDLFREAVDANVAGFVLRTDHAATMEIALREVAAGKRYHSRDVAVLLDERRKLPAEPAFILSPRERQVLKEIARGRLSKEIATSLGMSVFGVQNVRRRITRKTGLKSVAQLTLYAAKLLLVSGAEQR